MPLGLQFLEVLWPPLLELLYSRALLESLIFNAEVVDWLFSYPFRFLRSFWFLSDQVVLKLL